MRIGEFTEKHKVTKDTIRHYIDLGLIIPLKNGAHYEFDDTTDEDLKDIILFKDMGFSLNEIKTIFTFKRLGKLTNYQAVEYYRSFFINKLVEIDEKINQLNTMKVQLNHKLTELSQYNHKKQFKMGISLSSLSLLTCHHCQSSLTLINGTIMNNQIIEGEFHCTCGINYRIEDGILIVNELKENNPFDEQFLVDYAIHTPSTYIDSIYKSFIWFDSHIDHTFFNNQVVLDLGVGLGFTLRHIYESLEDSTTYIAVDHDINQLRLLKNLLEYGNIKKNILFICCDFLEIPIRNKSVDLVIDGTGSSNYAFKNDRFLIPLMNHHLKDHSRLLGSYIVYSKMNKDNPLPEKNRKLFNETYLINQIKEIYSMIDTGHSDLLTEGGKFESYINEGEKVYCLLTYAEKTNKAST